MRSRSYRALSSLTHRQQRLRRFNGFATSEQSVRATSGARRCARLVSAARSP